MKKEKLGAFIDAVYAIIITICILELEKPETLTWEGLWAVRGSFLTYTVTFFMMISMWVQIHFLWEQIEQIDDAVIWSSAIFLFTSSFIPYATSIMMTDNFHNTWFAVIYGLLTIFISLNLLVIQKTAVRCNEHILGRGRKSKIMPNQRIMFIDILIKLAGTIISILWWPPFILIAVLVAFEYNSFATRHVKKKMKRSTPQQDKVESKSKRKSIK